jgi:hypothetical protein
MLPSRSGDPAEIPAVLTRRDLPELGIARRELASWISAGTVVQIFRGVYVRADALDDTAVRARALARVLPPGAAVAREAAAWLHGIDCRAPGRLDEPLPLDCVVATGREPVAYAGVRGHADLLGEQDLVDVDGVPVTSPGRTLLDLARFSPTFMGLAAADALARAYALDLTDLRCRLEEWAGQRHVRRARRVLELCEPDAESFGESWTRLRLVDAGFPRPEPQIWIYDSDGVGLYRLDMGWRDRRIAVEYDGAEFHSSPEQREADIARRGHLAKEFDWRVVGVDKGDVLGRQLRLELGVGELLSLEPQIRRRLW